MNYRTIIGWGMAGVLSLGVAGAETEGLSLEERLAKLTAASDQNDAKIKIKWSSDLFSSVGEAKESGKPLFLMIGADWCPHAARVRHIYCGQNTEVRSLLQDFVCVRMLGEDASRMLSVVGSSGYPTLVCFTSKGVEAARFNGAPTLQEMIEGLRTTKQVNDGEAEAGELLVAEGLRSAEKGVTSPDLGSGGVGADTSLGGQRMLSGEGRNTIVLTEDGRLDMERGGLKLTLAKDGELPKMEVVSTKDGERLRFVHADGHIKKVVSSRGFTSEVTYFYPEGKTKWEDRKMGRNERRLATAEEMKEAGFASPETVPDNYRLIDFQYTKGGNVTRMIRKEGEEVLADMALHYNEKEQISKMVDARTDRYMTFEYNEISKPIEMLLYAKKEGGEEYERVGGIKVGYDQAGEITEVDSADGHVMALQVTQMFQSLLKVTKEGAATFLEEHFYY